LRDRFARWAAELREHGPAASLRARLYRDAGTGELAQSVRGYYEAIDRRLGDLERLERLELLVAMGPTMAWIEQASLAREPLVSVILATRNRATLLARAVGSVLAQTYSHLELVVIDDGSTDETMAVLERIDDPRLVATRIEHGGVGAARNAGLERAGGELIAYLDDDNTMHPGWLRSVAWAFEQRPESEVLYGGLVIEDVHHTLPDLPPALPRAIINPFDRERLGEFNLADISAMAHRANLPAARFDETLPTMADWDLLARLCADRDPLVVPVISCYYTTSADDRLTGGPSARADAERVRARLRTTETRR
jgi:Glycosyl transferase family 2